MVTESSIARLSAYTLVSALVALPKRHQPASIIGSYVLSLALLESLKIQIIVFSGRRRVERERAALFLRPVFS
jgi:hypothetical protein